MLYPLKFQPIFKSYLWGGRELEKLGKKLPEGIVAESWEVSCHPDGVSVVSNGQYKDMPLPALIDKFGRKLLGSALPESSLSRFPLLVKLIDANDRLSIQVHPDDEYAGIHEDGEYGKNEMWYVISAKPGAKLICGVLPWVTREVFEQAVRDGKIESTLNMVEVFPGDIISIPAGFIHAIGKGLVVAEIQQSSNVTYRIYDYGRKDKDGKPRPLHINKALEVIDFNGNKSRGKIKELYVSMGHRSSKAYLTANKYFCVEKYMISRGIDEDTAGKRFYMFLFLEGGAEIIFDGGAIRMKRGESVLIPASIGRYRMDGSFQALKAYVPELYEDVVNPLTQAGYTMSQIACCVEGLR